MNTEQMWQELLEKCGINKVCIWGEGKCLRYHLDNCRSCKETTIPPPTLDNIFKYVIPKLFWKLGGTEKLILFLEKWVRDTFENASDPAEALIAACYKEMM